MRIRIDEDTQVRHLVSEMSTGDQALCGLGIGWTDQKKPIKKAYSSTCDTCQDVVRDVKTLRK